MIIKLINLILLISAVLSLLNCSRPHSIKIAKWFKHLAHQVRKTRKKDDHIRAALIVHGIDNWVAKKVMGLARQVMGSPTVFIKNKKISGWAQAMLFLGPFIYLMLLSDNHGSIIFQISVGIMIYFILISFFFIFVVLEDPHPAVLVKGVHYTAIRKRKFLYYLFIPLIFLFGFRPSVLTYENGHREPAFRLAILHLSISVMLCSIATLILIHKSMINALEIPAIAFYPLFIFFGPVFFMVLGLFAVAAIYLPFAATGARINKNKAIGKGAAFLSLTTTVSFILYYSSQFEIPRIFLSLTPFPIYINVLADMYVIYLFLQLTELIIRTRKNSGAHSKTIIREYVLFIIRTIIASITSIYFAFLLTDNPLNIIQAARLFVGQNPVAHEQYLGTIFWLTHTAFLPLLIILTIPILLIAYRLILLFYNQILVRILRYGNPIVYITSFLMLLVTILQFSTDFIS